MDREPWSREQGAGSKERAAGKPGRRTLAPAASDPGSLGPRQPQDPQTGTHNPVTYCAATGYREPAGDPLGAGYM